MTELKEYDFVKNEEEVQKYWEENNCFQKLMEKNKGGKKYRFIDGPITANNKMGIHHAFGRSLKDCFLRYKAMQGCTCHYRNGFDGQGLWVEVEVEKELGFKTKKDIEKYGMDNFTKACVNRVKKYSSVIKEQSKRLGQWMDWDNYYYTLTDENITSIWYFLKMCNEKGIIKETYKPMPWCIRCGTSISEHEMTGSYHQVTCKAVFLKLPIEGKPYKVLVWTTTPWTLCANVALAVNPKFDYVVVKFEKEEETLLLCKEVWKNRFKSEGKVLETIKGSELEGLKYETCFEELNAQKNVCHKIVTWDMVDSIEGSGIVHIAPGCGAEDFDLGQSLGLDKIIPIDESGIIYDDFGFLAGKKASECSELVFSELKRRNKLYLVHEYEHSYPYCWRCKEDIMFRLVKEWAIDVNPIREKLIENAKKVKYSPAYQEKRMIDWLTNMSDWSISRRRYYGLPLPFYKCECGELTVVGSKEELRELAVDREMVDNLKELHRPWIDDIEIRCPHCGKKVKRVPQVGDVWLDAGIVPFSTLKYFEDKDYWSEYFPAESVVEATEQIRLWFYSMLFMSTVLEGIAPYESIVTYGMVVKEDGSKFSKSNKNDLTFDDVVVKSGADCVRYNYLGTSRVNDIRFGWNMLKESKKKLMAFYNIVSFFDLYYSIDKPELSKECNSSNISDRWLEARTDKFIKESESYYEDFNPTGVIKLFEECTDDVSNWYIRINRKRFWKSDLCEDKLNAYNSLYTTIKKMIQVMAPIIPFFTEYVWIKLIKKVEQEEAISVHLTNFPKCDAYDEEILKTTESVRGIIANGLKIRNQCNMKVKQPLKNMYLCGYNDEEIKSYESIIKDELNIKNLIYIESETSLCTSFLSLNFKEAGKVYKNKVNVVKDLLNGLSQEKMDDLVNKYENDEKLFINDMEIFKETLNLSYSYYSNIKVSKENERVICIDTTVTPELLKEGQYREILRKCQIMRKEAGFNVTDKIIIGFSINNNDILSTINDYKDNIEKETLSKVVLDRLRSPIYTDSMDFNGFTLVIDMNMQ